MCSLQKNAKDCNEKIKELGIKNNWDYFKFIENRIFCELNKGNITNDSIDRWFNPEYLKKNPDVYNFFFKILERLFKDAPVLT